MQFFCDARAHHGAVWPTGTGSSGSCVSRTAGNPGIGATELGGQGIRQWRLVVDRPSGFRALCRSLLRRFSSDASIMFDGSQAARLSRRPPSPQIRARAAARRAARALAHIRSVRARWVAGRAVRCIFGNTARLVFKAPFAESATPDVLREAVCDVGKRLGITPEQAFTFTGSSNVKGPGKHHCRHRWRLLLA